MSDLAIQMVFYVILLYELLLPVPCVFVDVNKIVEKGKPVQLPKSIIQMGMFLNLIAAHDNIAVHDYVVPGKKILPNILV